MTSHRIRWSDRTLSPYEQSFVPAGFRPVVQLGAARKRFQGVLAAAELSPRLVEQYAALWDTCLPHGMQESGLVLACLRVLADSAGWTSSTVPKGWCAFCVEQRVWVRIPGRLAATPSGTRDPSIGQRVRAYLVIEPVPVQVWWSHLP
jgi:hypothetical protein